MEIEQIRETLDSANSAAIIIGENHTEEKFLLREALASFLKDKNISVFLLPETPKTAKDKWPDFLEQEAGSRLPNRTSIKISKKNIKINELEYDEDDEFLNINLFSSAGKIEKEHVIIEPKPTEVDIAFCFCNPTADEIKKIDGLAIKKEMIFIIPDGKTISEKVFELMQKTNPYISFEKKNIPNLVLSALLLETENFRKNMGEGVLLLAHNLLSLGADKKLLEETGKKELPLAFGQILGRAMARTRNNKNLKSYWTFLTKEDFEKTGVNGTDVDIPVRIIRETFKLSPGQPISVILWQRNDSVWCLTAKNSGLEAEEIFKKIEAVSGKQSKNGLIALGPYKNFSLAEVDVQKNLKESIF
jgi:hypothetical protein